MQEDKQGFTVTEAPVLNVDDQVSHMLQLKSPGQLCMLNYTQAGALRWVHSKVQQQAAVLQNTSGLAEEVRHAVVTICPCTLAT